MLNRVGFGAYYWSSSPDAAAAYFLEFHSGIVTLASYYYRTYGFPVRCVKEFILVFTKSCKSAKREKNKLKEKNLARSFIRQLHLMEEWPINSAARQQEQEIYFPLVINQDCIRVRGLLRPQIHSIQRLFLSRCRVS
jgi:hypothetical protein